MITMSTNEEQRSEQIINKIVSVAGDAIKNTDFYAMKKIQKTQNKNHKENTRPGRLFGSIPFEIHTMDAQLLFSGYINKGSVGLLQFAGQMSTLWDASEKDDPYADWYLLKVYDAIIQLRNQFAQSIQDYQEKIRETYGQANLLLTPFVSQKPVVKNLWFRTQYGYLGAGVVGDFDELMRFVLTANRVGVLLDKPQEAIRSEWIDKVIALFQLPFKWQSFMLTRSDIEADNDLAKSAQKTLGKIPRNVLDKTLRAPFSPYINVESEIKQKIISDQETTETKK